LHDQLQAKLHAAATLGVSCNSTETTTAAAAATQPPPSPAVAAPLAFKSWAGTAPKNMIIQETQNNHLAEGKAARSSSNGSSTTSITCRCSSTCIQSDSGQALLQHSFGCVAGLNNPLLLLLLLLLWWGQLQATCVSGHPNAIRH
jgi:hypothetical protein